jgi:hypothetical protein
MDPTTQTPDGNESEDRMQAFMMACIELLKVETELVYFQENERDCATDETTGSPVHTGQNSRQAEFEEKKTAAIRLCDELIEQGNALLSLVEASVVGDGPRCVKSADCTDEGQRQSITRIRSLMAKIHKGKTLIQSIPSMATIG